MNTLRALRSFLPVILLLVAGGKSSAANIVWTNTAGGNWNVAANWSPNQVPGAADDAVITNNGTYTITLNINLSVASLVLGGSSGTQTISQAVGGFALGIPSGTIRSNGQFNLTGNFSSGNLTVAGGVMNWTEGTIGSATSVNVASNGVLNLSGAGQKNLNGALTNASTVNWSGGNISSGSGILHNGADALFDMQGNLTLFFSGSSAFINQGVFRKSGGTGTAAVNGSFINSGTVDAQAGTINLVSIVIGNGSAFIGAGTNQLTFGSATLAGGFSSQNLVLNGGTLGGTGTLESGIMAWLNGTIGSDASFTVSSNAVLNLSGNGGKNINGTLTNAGTVTWAGPISIGFNGGTLHNASGGVFDAQGNASMFQNSPPTSIINQGIMRKSAGAGTTTIAISFVNEGLVEGRSGTLLFNTTFTNPIGNIAVAGGKVQSSQPLIVPAGSITGFGTVQAPSVIVSGLVRPGATNNTLTISGNYTQSIAGRMEFDIGGTSPGTDQSQVNIIGAAQLDGLIGLRFTNGYSPAVGSSNVVLTASSRSGQFRFQNYFFLLGQNKRVSAIYHPTNVILTTISGPDPTGPSLSAGVSGQTFAVAWPSEFPGYSLYLKTNLSDSVWTLLPGITNLYVENPLNADRKFFRLIHD